MNVFRDKLSQISEKGYLDAWLTKYTVTSAVFNFVRSLKLKQYAKKICLPRYVWSRKRDDVIWHKCYLYRNWKKDFKNLSLGTANRSLKPPWLVATINAKQIVRNLFFQNKVRVDIFSVQTFASTFDTTQIFMRKDTIVPKLEESSIGHLYSCFHSDTVRNTETYALNLC